MSEWIEVGRIQEMAVVSWIRKQESPESWDFDSACRYLMWSGLRREEERSEQASKRDSE